MNVTLRSYDEKVPFLVVSIISTLLLALLIPVVGLLAPVMLMLTGGAIVLLIIILKNPFNGLMSLLAYCFVVVFFEREIDGFPLNYGVELLYFVVFISIIVNINKYKLSVLNNDLCILFTIWFIISFLQLFNPSGASPRGWLHEIRTSGLDSFFLTLSGFLIFKSKKHLNSFLYIIIGLSLLATLDGVKQLHFGLFPGEQNFLLNSPSHLVWGKIRVFSLYGDAGQFGASQAHLSVICGVLALGPFKIWKRIALFVLSIVFFYGMLISGTRGAFFALLPGIFMAIFLFKNIKVLLLGTLFTLVFLGGLKYTHIGSSNYHVFRLRTALNPEDPSLNVRFTNQERLSKYMKDYPFGGGLGVIGYAGHEYNPGLIFATVEPDSYWVKVWAMYGIVGFTFWFCMMMYIIGKSSGIVWRIKDKGLRVKLIALTAGLTGIIACSYGNEVINAFPSSIIVYFSMVFVFLGPKLDENNDKLIT